jgi:hypothetical protein
VSTPTGAGTFSVGNPRAAGARLAAASTAAAQHCAAIHVLMFCWDKKWSVSNVYK